MYECASVGPGMHTRAGTPIPNISLSTELPAQLVAELALPAVNAQASGQAGTPAAPTTDEQQPAEATDTSTDLSTEQSLPAEQEEQDAETSANAAAAGRAKQRQTGGSLADKGLQEQAGANMKENGARGQAGASLAGQQRVQAAPDLDPSSSSDSDSDEEGGPLGGLAASMWAALHKQRRQPGVGGSSRKEQPVMGGSGVREQPGAGRSGRGSGGSGAKVSAVRRHTEGNSGDDDDSQGPSPIPQVVTEDQIDGGLYTLTRLFLVLECRCLVQIGCGYVRRALSSLELKAVIWAMTIVKPVLYVWLPDVKDMEGSKSEGTLMGSHLAIVTDGCF